MNRELLVAILAHVDAIFMPDRLPPTGRRRTIFYCERRDYLAVGLPIKRIGAGFDAADRLKHSNDLAELQRRKMIKIRATKGTRSTSIAMTHLGDCYARCLVGCPLIDESIPLMQILQTTDQRITSPPVFRDWIPETVLTGTAWGGDVEPFAEAQLVLTPALVRGLVRSNADNNGRLWYQLTAAGVAFLEKPCTLPPRLPASNQELCQHFCDVRAAARSAIASLPYDEGEVGDIPLPESAIGLIGAP